MNTWWKVVNGNATDLRQCASLWGGVTAGVKAFDSALLSRNYTGMVAVLSEVWAQAPDHPSIHKQPGWSVLCNLLDGTVPPPGGEDDG
jgi:hypothetical protein